MKTVRVRIAVAVHSSGEWRAYGSSGGDDDDKASAVRFHGDNTIRFVEADVAVPETIEGEVSQ